MPRRFIQALHVSLKATPDSFQGCRNSEMGFGKFIDNSSSLVTLSVSIDNVNKQIISFDGSFNSNNGNINNLNGSSFNYL